MSIIEKLVIVSIVSTIAGLFYLVVKIVDIINLEAVELRLSTPGRRFIFSCLNIAVISLLFTPLFIKTIGSNIHSGILEEVINQGFSKELAVKYGFYFLTCYSLMFLFISSLTLMLISLSTLIFPVYSYSLEIGDKDNLKKWYILKSRNKNHLLLVDNVKYNKNKTDVNYLLLLEKEVLGKNIKREKVEGKDKWFWRYRNLMIKRKKYT